MSRQQSLAWRSAATPSLNRRPDIRVVPDPSDRIYSPATLVASESAELETRDTAVLWGADRSIPSTGHCALIQHAAVAAVAVLIRVSGMSCSPSRGQWHCYQVLPNLGEILV